jgi:hypothetical protein
LIGVAALHALVPPLLHLDLKSKNFLVAVARGAARKIAPFEVKVADLELSVEAWDAQGFVDLRDLRLPETINVVFHPLRPAPFFAFLI